MANIDKKVQMQGWEYHPYREIRRLLRRWWMKEEEEEIEEGQEGS